MELYFRMKRLHVDRARGLRRNMTDAEHLLWYHLRNRRLLGWKFRRQHEVDRYIVDFICPDASLIVELDGGQHADAAEQMLIAHVGLRQWAIVCCASGTMKCWPTKKRCLR